MLIPGSGSAWLITCRLPGSKGACFSAHPRGHGLAQVPRKGLRYQCCLRRSAAAGSTVSVGALARAG
eukprot:1464537-Pyramimonas_sp.AAC.1